MEPGPEIGRTLEVAARAQRDRVFRTREEALQWLAEYLAQTYPLLTGQDLLDRGLPPGPEFGSMLKQARTLQASGVLTSREQALAWLEERVREAANNHAS